MKLLINLFFLSLLLNSTNLLSLEVTVPLSIDHLLSKTQSTKIVGSSNNVLNQKDLDKYENKPLHDILDMIPGIKSRSIYGSNSSGSKTTLDIRGMGAQAKSNVLILINGQRLNNIDMSEIDFPSIPLDSISKIEVFKGNSAAVLYGDGAIGGAINIITNQKKEKIPKTNSEIAYKIGSFNKKEYIWNNSTKQNGFSLNVYLNHKETDGYRDENESQQNNVTSEIFFPGQKINNFIAVNFSEQIMSTPSDRSQDELYSDRKGSDTPNDYVNSIGGSFLHGIDINLDDNKKLIINSSYRQKDSYSDLQTSASYPSYSATYLKNYQFTPRINHSLIMFNKNADLTYGLDLQYSDYESKRKKNEHVIPKNIYSAWQTTQSLYTQQNIELFSKTNLGLGLRLQKNLIGITDILNVNAPDYNSWDYEHLKFSDQELNYAVNFGLEHQVNNISVYGRLGNGFRYPNIDDRIGGSGKTSFELDTQKTNEYELGTKYKLENFDSNISIYMINGKKELAYDADNYVNTNMPDTQRYGLELYTKNQITNKIIFINNFAFAKAKYTENYPTSNYKATVYNQLAPVKDKDIPLVPKYSLDSSIELNFSNFFKVIPSIRYQDDMRMENDEENFQNTKIPSHILGNITISSKFNTFFSTLSINNIFDKEYFNYAVSSSNTVGTYNAYPEPGREIIFTIGAKF